MRRRRQNECYQEHNRDGNADQQDRWVPLVVLDLESIDQIRLSKIRHSGCSQERSEDRPEIRKTRATVNK
jgi:hypothetical protein